LTFLIHQILLERSVRGVRLAGHAARMGKMRNVYKIFVGKPEGKITQKTRA